MVTVLMWWYRVWWSFLRTAFIST